MTTETHTTPACMFCHRSSVVELTAEEAAALRAGALIQGWLEKRELRVR